VSAVVDFYGVSDVDTLPSFLESMPPEWVAELEANGTAGEADPTTVILKGSPLAPENARRLLSPVHHARAGAPPFLLVHGEADGVVPPSQSVELRDALQAAGVPVELELIENADHVFEGADPLPPIRRAVAFLRAHLAEPKGAS
jgi:acetyl esterase/lipase